MEFFQINYHALQIKKKEKKKSTFEHFSPKQNENNCLNLPKKGSMRSNTTTILYFIHILIFLFIKYFIWERTSVSESGEKPEENIQANSPLSVEPHEGLDPTTNEIMTWAKNKGQLLSQPSHPDGPIHIFF